MAKEVWRYLVTTALETVKLYLVTLTARLKRYNSDNKTWNINKLFSTNASIVKTLFLTCNRSVDQQRQYLKKARTQSYMEKKLDRHRA